jgi:hypothetical protein
VFLLTLDQNVLVSVAEGRDVAHVEVTMNFLKAAELVAEVASASVHAGLLTVEGAAVLGLVLIVHKFLLLGKVQRMLVTELFFAVSVLAKVTISAMSILPVIAELTLVHRPLHKALSLDKLVPVGLELRRPIEVHAGHEGRGASSELEGVRVLIQSGLGGAEGALGERHGGLESRVGREVHHVGGHAAALFGLLHWRGREGRELFIGWLRCEGALLWEEECLGRLGVHLRYCYFSFFCLN